MTNRTISSPADPRPSVMLGQDPQRLVQGAYSEMRGRAEARGHGGRTVGAGVGGLVGGMAGSFKGGWVAALCAAAGAIFGAMIGDTIDKRQSDRTAALGRGEHAPELPRGSGHELARDPRVSAPVRRTER